MWNIIRSEPLSYFYLPPLLIGCTTGVNTEAFFFFVLVFNHPAICITFNSMKERTVFNRRRKCNSLDGGAEKKVQLRNHKSVGRRKVAIELDLLSKVESEVVDAEQFFFFF